MISEANGKLAAIEDQATQRQSRVRGSGIQDGEGPIGAAVPQATWLDSAMLAIAEVRRQTDQTVLQWSHPVLRHWCKNPGFNCRVPVHQSLVAGVSVCQTLLGVL
eukprot:CAMPEP_0172700756 /NCGR_PEP_ID=MMETSP1074-20121228/31133_1 /TAXON_ID=2916 /ORGANISM="Ceratium fusus, Strain PA161109" /LENGTH=104 /DNA_ID=CAMNT_0013522191 /DNA_START=849 /DNA_END=1165 /DNA_ORIENTATION=+